MKKLILLSVLILSSGCTQLITWHDDYCINYTQEQREAFRTLAANTVKIECERDGSK